jgi:hypothetical protein
MKKKTQTQFRLLILGLCAALTVIAVGVSFAGSKTTQSQNSPSERRAVLDAARRGGYRELAKLKGSITVTRPVHSFVKYDLETITKKSAVVVIGHVLNNACHISPDGQQVTTDYQVQVQEVLKGKVSEGSTIEVNLPGGLVVFEDGTSVQVNTPGLRKMQNGKTYVLFLTERGPEFSSFVLTGGSQGLFEIVDGGLSVKPYGNSIDPLVQKYKQEKEAKLLLKRARQAAKTWPEPSACCK